MSPVNILIIVIHGKNYRDHQISSHMWIFIGIFAFTMVHSKGQGQGNAHFDNKHLENSTRVKTTLPSNSKSSMAVRLAYYIRRRPTVTVKVKVKHISTANILEIG